jgi:hypothetical protein
MGGFVDECRKQYNEWMNQEGLSGAAKFSCHQEIAGFRDAFEAFDADTNDAPEQASDLWNGSPRPPREPTLTSTFSRAGEI